jgi:hypothetical protein
MPKGKVEPREVVCHACGTTFTSDKAGKAAFFCRSVECDARRERVRREARAAERAERGRARAEERARVRRERAQQARMEAARKARMKTIQKKVREKRLEIFAPILDDPEQMLLITDALEIIKLASTVEPTRAALKKAVVAMAMADGRTEEHAAARMVAAVAMRIADNLGIHATREIEAPNLDEDEGEQAAA